eukprot:CAMPEP_0172520536 /NCGR_PEP_ID=MMETSP1066-20121228/292064_1 /TAXON_ID=671091 /ORGANISM="Coscinodiscus wailesii, Strain CCMP2513" /LENGTH=69 /DNA_ID=CAMNT_0013303317 /DNA_START=622 /DNA_END=831 /DNA_ORIENTATION=+
MTPDSHFIVDYLPGSSEIVLGAGFSGHGFKLSPVVGKALFELSCGNVNPQIHELWSCERFETSTPSSNL